MPTMLINKKYMPDNTPIYSQRGLTDRLREMILEGPQTHIITMIAGA